MCPVSVTPTRDEIGARNSAPLRLFNVLSSASSKARSTAVDELCSFHDKHDGEVMSTQLLSERDPALAYTLKRLIRGLASPAKCARQGFAAALTVLLDHFPKRIDTSTLMMCLNDNLNPNHNVGGETRGNAMTKSERKQFMLGKVFAALVLCRANRIHQLDEHYVITLASEIRKLSNADWLSELCAETLAAIVVASKSVSSLRQALTVLLAPLINDTTSRIAPIVSLAFDDDAQRVNVSLKHVVDSLRRVVALRAQPHRTCYHVLAHHQSCFEHIFHSFVHKELLSETRSNAQLCTALHLYEIVVNNQFYTVEHCVSSPQVIEMLHSALTSRIDVLQQCGKRLLNAMIDMCINAVTLIQTLGVEFDETTGSNSLNAIASKLTAEQLYDYTTSLAGELTTQDIERKRHVITALFSLARLHSIDSVSHYKCRIVCIKAMLTCDNEPDLAELCRTHVKTLVRSDAAFIEILNDVENKVKTISFVTFCSASVTARKHMKKAVRQLKEIAESNSSSSTTLPSTICHASRTMLLYLAAFQIWCDEKFVSDLMTELSVACIALTKSSTLSENDIVKHVNVLVDMCLSLLVHDSALLRDACKAVMRLMAEHINAIALEDMLRVVADGYYIEAESTRVDSDDDEDDDDEDDEDNDDDDDDDENDKDDDEGEDNDDDDDDAESDSSASDSNDEQPSIPMDTVDDAKSLQRYDQYLIKYINLRNSIKKEKQDTLLTSLNFCLRVVSLLDIFVRKCKRHILLPTMIVPLLSVIQSSSSSGFNHSLLHTARVKLLQSVVSTIPPSSADDSVCREILSCAATAARRSSVAPLVGSTLLYALKMCNSSNVDKKFVSDLITPLFVDFFSRKRSKVAHKLLLSLVERCFAAIPYALGVIATATETGVSDFLRSAAFIMLDTIVKRHSKHDLFVATVHTHARDIKSALLIALTTTSVRRKLAIRFTIKFFKFLMAHNKPIHNLLDTNLRCALQNASDQEPKGDIKVMFSKYAAFIDNLTSSSRKPRSKT